MILLNLIVTDLVSLTTSINTVTKYRKHYLLLTLKLFIKVFDKTAKHGVNHCFLRSHSSITSYCFITAHEKCKIRF